MPSMTVIHANTATSANAVLRPSVASATPSIAAIAVSSDVRAIAATSAIHQSASVPAVVPFASTAGRNDARKTTWSTNAMTNARMPHAAVRERWSRTRRGSHVSTVVIVPARHSAPATVAPPKSPPRSRKKRRDEHGAVAARPVTHQSASTAGCSESAACSSASVLPAELVNAMTPATRTR